MDAIVAVGAMAQRSELRSPCLAMCARNGFQRSASSGVTPPAPNCSLPRAGRLVEGRVSALLLGELRRGGERVEIDLFRNALREHPRFRRVERQAHLEEDVLKSHEPEAHRPPTE